MTGDPVQHFLGTNCDAGPARLLGLHDAGQPLTAPMIEDALRRRLAEVYNHPDGRSPAADEVRAVLRGAATTLKAQHARPRLAPQPVGNAHRGFGSRLTPFDQQVLAVLVGSGGWNATSRARLIVLAAAHGVTSQGLVKVVVGLARSKPAVQLRKGGTGSVQPRALSVAELGAGTNGQGRTHRQPPSSAKASACDVIETRDESEPSHRTLTLSICYGLLALLLSMAALGLLVPPPMLERAASALHLPLFQSQDLPRSTAVSPDRPRTIEDSEVDESIDIPHTDADRERRREHVDWGIATFQAPPTFQVPFPQAAYDSKQIAQQSPDDLDAIARHVGVAARRSEVLAESVFRTWSDVLEQVGGSWVLLEEGLLRTIERSIIDVLLAADSHGSALPQSDVSRLFKPFDPPAGEVRDSPDLWRGAWLTKMLAFAATHSDLPESARSEARARLAIALGRSPDVGIDHDWRISPTRAGSIWLERVLPVLVDAIAEPSRAYEVWEAWIAANRGLNHEERFNSAILAAITVILAEHPSDARLASVGLGPNGSRIDPESNPPDINVIGRLLHEADFDRSPRTRELFLALFDDERIGAPDLWLITSMLARSRRIAWFGEDYMLVVVPQDDRGVRRRVMQNIANAWPELEAAPIARRSPVDPVVGERWLRIAVDIETESIEADSELALLGQILRAARMNEAAAHLASQKSTHAERSIDRASGQARTSASADQRRRPADGAFGSDGGWAAAYEEARRDVEERMRLLRALRSGAGGDLWPNDAAVFVREVYRGAPTELRELAQSMLVDQFHRGPNIALAMLDQFPAPGAAPRNRALAQTLSRYTRRSLPPLQEGSQGWAANARLGLVKHLLTLVHDQAPIIDTLADDIGGSYGSQADALMKAEHAMGSEAAMAPEAGAARIFDYWRERAHGHAASRLGSDVEAFERRHAARLRMADGPIQKTIVLRIGTLELMGIVTRAELGGSDRRIARILEQSASQRSEAPSALIQALHVERAMIAMWRARLHVEDRDAASGSMLRGGSRMSNVGASSLLLLSSLTSMRPADRLAVDRPEEQWHAQLEALHPERPLEYFELAEELADTGERDLIDLAKRLFALAGALDPARLGRSACLALADLETTEHGRSRMLALAEVLGTGGLVHHPAVAPEKPREDPDRQSAALALSEAFSLYRQGQGPRAAQALRRDDVRRLLEEVEGALPWPNVQAFIDDCLTPRPRRPSVPESRLVRMLQVERFLLGGEERTWSTELAFTHGRPLIEVDPERVDLALNVDVTRPYFRGGRWVRTAQ